MRQERRRLAEQILEASQAHDALQPDRLLRFRNVERETAELLALLIRSTRARSILEIGTSNGYSTIWLADAAEATGGKLVSVEIDPERTESARANLARAELAAELRTEDAAQTLQAARDGCWDFVFLDAERPAYAGYWPHLLRTLRPDGGPTRDRQRALACRRSRGGEPADRCRAVRRVRARPDRRRSATRRTRSSLARKLTELELVVEWMRLDLTVRGADF